MEFNSVAITTAGFRVDAVAFERLEFILVSCLSHRLVVKSRESVIFVDVFCLEHDLDAL